jgi:carboxyl-terminal processing protease
MTGLWRATLFAFGMLLAIAAAAKDKVTTALEHYEIVQKMRSEASTAMRDKKPAEADLRKSISILKEALHYLDNPAVRELASGNIYLDGRRHDVLIDLAASYLYLGEKDKSLDALEAAQHEFVSPLVTKFSLQQEPFVSLRENPRFKAILAQADAVERLWSVPAIATPFREKLPIEERVAGLSLFWAEVRHNFVNFKNIPSLEWDKAYLQTLSQVMAAETTYDYYDAMMKFAPLLQDGHTNIYPPDELAEKFFARPPMFAQRIDGKVLVTQVKSATLSKRVQIGDEIVAIDGMPVERYANERVMPYVSSSTPQDKVIRAYTYQLLSGDSSKSLTLKLRNAAGAERIETISRRQHGDEKEPAQFTFRLTKDAIAYISLDHFESDDGVKAFEKALPEIMNAKGLVIDVRRNGGGSTNFGLDILSYLSDKPIANAAQHVRAESALFRAQGGSLIRWVPVSGSDQPYERKRAKIFSGPIAVLIGPQTFSAAEDFVLSYDVMKRGLLIGEATGGSTGQPLMLKLPGGGTARICVKRDSYPDGRAFVGKGIAPHIEVKSSAADVRAGSDPVLVRAIAELLKTERK